MGLFNKNKKQQLIEIENEFDYNKMMAAAKEAGSLAGIEFHK